MSVRVRVCARVCRRGAMGKLVGVVSIGDTTVYDSSNSTAVAAARISTTILDSMWACTRTSACTYYVVYVRTRIGTRVPWFQVVCETMLYLYTFATLVHVYQWHLVRFHTSTAEDD